MSQELDRGLTKEQKLEMDRLLLGGVISADEILNQIKGSSLPDMEKVSLIVSIFISPLVALGAASATIRAGILEEFNYSCQHFGKPKVQ